MIVQRIVIAQHERGLVLRDKRIQTVLMPGVYWHLNVKGQVNVVDIRNAILANQEINALIDSNAELDKALCEKHFNVVSLADFELALVYQRNTLIEVLKSGSRKVFWKDNTDVHVETISTKEEFRVPRDMINLLAKRTGVTGLLDQVSAVEVNAKQLGLLWVDGEMVETLNPGLHAFWKQNRSIKVELMELRLQNLEVAGQEILTKDKVSLRLNLSADYQLADPVRARMQLNNYGDFLYRQLQFSLRAAVGTRTLDALLADKEALNGDVFRAVLKSAAENGIKLLSVGVKDIILPGEMKDILNQVVATEKAALANVIRRREETAATRSLLNTAKLMESNPTLLRLKEIEALEKVVEKVDKISVFNGLDGLLNGTVKLT